MLGYNVVVYDVACSPELVFQINQICKQLQKSDFERDLAVLEGSLKSFFYDKTGHCPLFGTYLLPTNIPSIAKKGELV